MFQTMWQMNFIIIIMHGWMKNECGQKIFQQNKLKQRRWKERKKMGTKLRVQHVELGTNKMIVMLLHTWNRWSCAWTTITKQDDGEKNYTYEHDSQHSFPLPTPIVLSFTQWSTTINWRKKIYITHHVKLNSPRFFFCSSPPRITSSAKWLGCRAADECTPSNKSMKYLCT